MNKDMIYDIIQDHFHRASIEIMKETKNGDITPSQESEIDIALSKLADIMLEVFKQNNGQEHEPKQCNFPNCSLEASRWYEDPSYEDNTFYYCLTHEEDHEDPDPEFMVNSVGEKVEVGVYSCSDECPECN
jgi:hypothetical protein